VRARSVRLLAGGSLVVSALLCALGGVFLVLAWEVPPLPTEFGTKGYAIVFSVGFGTVGALIATKRPENPIGWLMCAQGLVAGVLAFANEYARWALILREGQSAGGSYAAWVGEWLWIPLIGLLGVVAALFPDGRFLSRRWRAATWAGVALAMIPTVLNAVIPRLTIYAGVDNPVGLGGDGLMDAAFVSISLLVPLVATGAAAAVRRLVRSRGEQRLQLKWLALAICLVTSLFVIGAVLAPIAIGELATSGLDRLEDLMVVSLLAVPVAIAFGVLKYRLYDIDLVIRKTVVYGALAAFISIVYVGIVIGVGAALGSRQSPVLSALAAAVVALAFQPARRAAQRLANRLVYGERATPYEVLTDLSSRFASTYSLEDALPRLARVTCEAVGARRCRVWLRVGTQLRPAAAWPDDEGYPAALMADDQPAFGDGEVGFPVRHQGELLGAISIDMPPSETLSPPGKKLLGDVATQAGLVLRNVALLEDLKASRQRLVAAQDEERRRIERNIHDGAQQQLVALTVQLRLAEGIVERDPAKAKELLGDLQRRTTDTLEDLRDLARGIYPPLLADKGLPSALEAQARKSPLSVRIDPDGVGRYEQDVESAVYFCCLEALNNVAKYAHASSVTIRLSHDDGELRFEVVDDGRGFDPGATGYGTGLQGMADRLDAIGGHLQVRSAPGTGTVVIGRIALDGRGAAP
jgi:signal transduction histidine kinase